MSEIDVLSVNEEEQSIEIRLGGDRITFQQTDKGLRAVQKVGLRQIPKGLKQKTLELVNGIAKDRFSEPA